MACLNTRARYVRGSANGRRAVRGSGPKWHLAWVIIFAVLVSLRGFFFRQLLSALLLFTVVFVIAAALITLFIGIDYAASSAISWAESQVRSIHLSMHHSVALPPDSPLVGQTVRCGDSRGSTTIDSVAKRAAGHTCG